MNSAWYDIIVHIVENLLWKIDTHSATPKNNNILHLHIKGMYTKHIYTYLQ